MASSSGSTPPAYLKFRTQPSAALQSLHLRPWWMADLGVNPYDLASWSPLQVPSSTSWTERLLVLLHLLHKFVDALNTIRHVPKPPTTHSNSNAGRDKHKPGLVPSKKTTYSDPDAGWGKPDIVPLPPKKRRYTHVSVSASASASAAATCSLLLRPPSTSTSSIVEATTSKRSAPTDTVTRSPDPHVPSNLADTIVRDEISWSWSSSPRQVPLQYLKHITNDFSHNRILGQGGFGVVYKGLLPNGQNIAVKKIVSSLMPNQDKQFESEVYHLMTLKHPNIVRLVGYCYETKKELVKFDGTYVFAETADKLLCFEYLPKGSLDKYLSDESSGLDWNTRYKIIDGICNGLCHLHEQIEKPVIHLDLKPANILLDDGMVPKITDFGLSRLLGQQETNCTSSRIGTFGYMAKEFLERGTITPKLDIFSLGVIILEVVTGHREYPDVTGTPSDDFIELMVEKWRNVLQRSASYEWVETYCEQIKRCLQVGLICVDTNRFKRPSIAKVIRMLQGLESIDCNVSSEATS